MPISTKNTSKIANGNNHRANFTASTMHQIEQNHVIVIWRAV